MRTGKARAHAAVARAEVEHAAERHVEAREPCGKLVAERFLEEGEVVEAGRGAVTNAAAGGAVEGFGYLVHGRRKVSALAGLAAQSPNAIEKQQ